MSGRRRGSVERVSAVGCRSLVSVQAPLMSPDAAAWFGKRPGTQVCAGEVVVRGQYGAAGPGRPGAGGPGRSGGACDGHDWRQRRTSDGAHTVCGVEAGWVTGLAETPVRVSGWEEGLSRGQPEGGGVTDAARGCGVVPSCVQGLTA